MPEENEEDDDEDVILEAGLAIDIPGIFGKDADPPLIVLDPSPSSSAQGRL